MNISQFIAELQAEQDVRKEKIGALLSSSKSITSPQQAPYSSATIPKYLAAYSAATGGVSGIDALVWWKDVLIERLRHGNTVDFKTHRLQVRVADGCLKFQLMDTQTYNEYGVYLTFLIPTDDDPVDVLNAFQAESTFEVYPSLYDGGSSYLEVSRGRYAMYSSELGISLSKWAGFISFNDFKVGVVAHPTKQAAASPQQIAPDYNSTIPAWAAATPSAKVEAKYCGAVSFYGSDENHTLVCNEPVKNHDSISHWGICMTHGEDCSVYDGVMRAEFNVLPPESDLCSAPCEYGSPCCLLAGHPGLHAFHPDNITDPTAALCFKAFPYKPLFTF